MTSENDRVVSGDNLKVPKILGQQFIQVIIFHLMYLNFNLLNIVFLVCTTFI